MALHDSPAHKPVDTSVIHHDARLFTLVEDSFRFGAEQQTLRRAYFKHLGAVAVLPVDEQDRVLLIGQYRHPVRMHLWEVPAGLLDVEGEPMLETAQRELLEEADLRAESWHTLVDYYTSPGASDEAIRIYLAQGFSAVPEAELHAREAEESEIVPTWVPLAEAVDAVLSGRIHNPSAVVGILALHAVRTGAGRLRDARAPWADQPRGVAP
ncbi:NUDIX domain-containing protein [Nesterenkonia xinjiangensis]|uniref:ADP-ribose pyrophosphatase n=1 Tax=Nesterenkonia xinjiangensis TaxID=225327 RepID=A0A7Z0KAP6_9MICC|nr:NUDIX hydrolase [Nesterenkonia xinjiangensis]NYJ79113.1 ADP-ribose pyrophosphatase [Nesterenkonia xinjiangensis]